MKGIKTPALIVSAKPGYTFDSEGAPKHVGGGEHGGLHKNDTLAALIIAGTDKTPEFLRIVDLKDYFLELVENMANLETYDPNEQTIKTAETNKRPMYHDLRLVRCPT